MDRKLHIQMPGGAAKASALPFERRPAGPSAEQTIAVWRTYFKNRVESFLEHDDGDELRMTVQSEEIATQLVDYFGEHCNDCGLDVSSSGLEVRVRIVR